jgi:hypothetical protein
MTDDVVPHRTMRLFPGAVILGDFIQMPAARDAIPRLAPGVALIVVLFLSLGLWGATWLVASALIAAGPW